MPDLQRLRRAVLALSLLLSAAGCGGDADGGDAEAPADSAAPAAARAAAVPADTPCAPLPAVTQFTTSGNNQPWSAVAAYVSASGLQFDAATSDSAAVTLCTGTADQCGPFNLTLVSAVGTQCLTQTALRGDSLRLLAVMVGDDLSAGAAARFGFGPQNPADSVYLMVQGGQAYSMYRTPQNRIRFVSGTPWSFGFYSDTTSATPVARWRDEDDNPHPGRDTLDDDDDVEPGDEEKTSFAWMACAGGCCQFHGTAPGGGGQTPGGVGQTPGVGNPPGNPGRPE